MLLPVISPFFCLLFLLSETTKVMDGIHQVLEQLSEITKRLDQQTLLKKSIFTFEEACQYIGISTSFCYKLTSTNKIPFYRPTGKLIFFKRTDLDEWLLRNRQSTVDEIENSANHFKLKDNSNKYIL